MPSSGQYVTTTTLDVECTGTVTYQLPTFSGGIKSETSWPCSFNGEVDVFVDPEVMWAGWECPTCGHTHAIDWDEFVEGTDS